MCKKVVFGMSGGVDSSTAAYMLKKEGYDVYGVTIVNYNDDQNTAYEAAEVCKFLGIKHIIIDRKNEFDNKIKKYFVSEYMSGRTPNPCVICNRHIKFSSLIDFKEQIGADFIATGHYAKISVYPKTGRFCIKIGNDLKKDQSYMLSYITQSQLKQTLFPLADYTKTQVREIADKAKIISAKKPDSQEICFIPNGDYSTFIQNYTGNVYPPGNYVDSLGNIIGKHKGIINYTIGQRKGLGVSFNKHMFVTKINADKNEVTLGDNAELFKKEVYAENINYMAIENINRPIRAEAKIRYAHKKAPCIIEPYNNGIKCVFDEPQRAPAPGQTIVVYDNDYCILGGTII